VAFQDQSRSVRSVYIDNMAADYMDSANLKHLSLFTLYVKGKILLNDNENAVGKGRGIEWKVLGSNDILEAKTSAKEIVENIGAKALDLVSTYSI